MEKVMKKHGILFFFKNPSSLVTVPPGPHVLSDILLTSAIVQGQDSVTSGNNGGSSSIGQFAEYGGIDPNVDPDLALAIKMSMEEEKRRQDKEKGEKSEKKETKVQEEEMIDDELYGDDEEEMDEEAMIQQALALSMQENKKEDKMEEENYDEDLYGDEEEEEEDEDLKMAMALSMKQPTDENVQDILQDDEYLNSVLDGLPGVDMKKDEKKKDEEKK
jgi:26S proteasome regulatory subunit N10